MLVIKEGTLFFNSFAYCDNDPVNQVDRDGFFSVRGILKKIREYVDFGWGRVTFKLNRVTSIVLAIISLLYRFGTIAKDVRSMQKLLITSSLRLLLQHYRMGLR